jgi:uncharacterized protein (DUF433 family)
MAKDYIEKRETGYYVIGSRIPIDSIVHNFLNGDSPETIRSSFPTLTLEEVYGAIAFYLGHRDAVEASIAIDEEKLANLLQSYREKDPSLFKKLEEARHAAQLQKQR